MKGFSILISFLLVPLTLNYLDTTKYGIWLTISGIVEWLGFFDIGLGNGLRNKLAEALALKDYDNAKIYVSTTYAVLILIIAVVYLLFVIINPFLNWARILNSSQNLNNTLSLIIMIIVTFYSLRFVLQLIGVVFKADQIPAFNNSLTPLANILSLIGILIISKFSSGNLLYLCFIYSAPPVIILVIASIYFYKKKYGYLKPEVNSIKLKYFKSLAGLGIQFFVIQIAVLIMFSTDNIIIAQILGPAEVAPYNIAFRYFGIPVMFMSIIMTPFWSASTEALSIGEIGW
ncbi:MAG: oligosaccharide flippase family protein, partial [Bacteroidetes bacterium]|nr:oligosaccharide flippase family protein [Bacteroidota bacterium]